ncbi:MAG: hypothetical protein QM680_10605 [Luteolibacter sp.]
MNSHHHYAHVQASCHRPQRQGRRRKELLCHELRPIPINHEADSVTQAKLISDALGNRCQYLIVKNQAHSEHFSLYEKSRTRSRLIDEFHAGEMVMPRMYDWLVAALNQHNLTATDALTHEAFGIVDRQRLKNWQRAFFSQLLIIA